MKRVAVLLLMLCMIGAPWQNGHALSGTEITVLKIGKADAIVITTSSHTFLIDAGEDEDAAEILAYLRAKRVERIDVLIITHYDKDHVGGADGLLDGIPVNAIYDANYESDSKQYQQYVEAVRANGVPRYRVADTLTLAYGEIVLTLMPTQLKTDQDNDHSLVLSMEDGWHTFFFAADAEEARIAELLADGIDPHDFVKMPHHGRMKTNLDALLDALMPSIAAITDSDKNPADTETLEMLAQRQIQTMQTRYGNVYIVSGPTGLVATQ